MPLGLLHTGLRVGGYLSRGGKSGREPEKPQPLIRDMRDDVGGDILKHEDVPQPGHPSTKLKANDSTYEEP